MTSVGPLDLDRLRPYPGRPRQEEIPPEVREILGGFGLAAGGANVIMQLARLPVGHGVARSTVDSGRVDKHPIKRLRTTSAFLVISMLGTEEERGALRREINRAHAAVHSEPGDPVPYDAFDPELQLWVAACLYKGTEDVHRLLFGHDVAPDRAEVRYQYAKRFGSTLQVTEEMWPADRAAFLDYWEAGVREIKMDALTRSYLQDIAQLAFLVAPLGRLGAPLRPLLAPIGRFLTLGYLPPQFRDELGLPWSMRSQRRFDAFMRVYAAVTRVLPRPLRHFPMNVYLADTRRRLRSGRPVV
ncbi:MAG: oxygenase MpaB family protein [Solirubrobacteraceae bacterium]